MTNPQAGLVKALRSATAFEVPDEILANRLRATPDLVREADRLAKIEAGIRQLLLHGTPLPPERRAAARPVLGNAAEAVVESLLVEAGWTPLDHDAHGVSFGHGVDLLMLGPALERVVTVEVKSTVQPARWRRLSRHGIGQLTPEWLDKVDNPGMRGLRANSSDVYVMIAQLQLTRRRWRACLGPTASSARPLVSAAQLDDLDWVDP